MNRFIVLLCLVGLFSCTKQAEPLDESSDSTTGKSLENANKIAMAYTNTFNVYERNGYKIVDLKAPIVSWGGDAKGGEQAARVVLVPREIEPPELTGDLANAVLIRTPVERIAINYVFLEAIVTTLELTDKLVAVGGVKGYDDNIRALTLDGSLAQVGYGWHMPPMIDPLLNSNPDVFFMVMGSFEHTKQYERIKKLGIPVVPIFFEAETSYMGSLDYVRLLGFFAGKETEANTFVKMVSDNVLALKALVADKPKKSVMNAWFAGSGRWMVSVRNAANALMEDAGGTNPFVQGDDVRMDEFVKMSSETLLEQARDIDCWIIRDSHSQSFDNVDFLRNFNAWNTGCLFAADGKSKPEVDAFDIDATGKIRPDIILRDLVKMLHPELISEPYIFVQPDTKTPRS